MSNWRARARPAGPGVPRVRRTVVSTVEPIDPAVLDNARREDLVASAAALFDVIASGGIRVEPQRTYRLAEAAQAHRDLEGSKTTGSVALLP